MQLPVLRPRQLETTALGAALLAGLAVGVFRDTSALSAQIEVERVFEPRMAAADAARARAGWRRALERSRGWAEEAE